MLLTSSQVSMAISGVIVTTFTLLLFLSGYILQQQTLRSLQQAIEPRVPKMTPTVILPAAVAPTAKPIPFGHPSTARGREYQQYIAQMRDGPNGWEIEQQDPDEVRTRDEHGHILASVEDSKLDVELRKTLVTIDEEGVHAIWHDSRLEF